jgi:predicted Na+-dependent transporter
MAVLIPLALFLVMVSLGLGLPRVEFDLLRTRPAFLLRVLVGSCLLVPLVAFVLLKLPVFAGLPADWLMAVALMALCPSAPLITFKSGRKGADAVLAAKLQFWTAAVAVVSVPALMGFFHRWSVAPAPVAAQVAQAQLIPLLLGVGLRRWTPKLADQINPLIQKLASVVMMLLLALILVAALPKVAPYVASNLLGAGLMLLLSAAALGIGLLVSGPQPVEQTTSALVVSMRNPGLALLLVQQFAPEQQELKLAVVAYVLITVLTTIPFLRWRQSLQEI